MRRRFLMVAGIVVLVMTGVVAWRNIPRIDTYTIEKSLFDPNAVCLFWTDNRDTPDPDTGEVIRSSASFWLDIAAGKVERAENVHPGYRADKSFNKPNKPVFGTIQFNPREISREGYSIQDKALFQFGDTRVVWSYQGNYKVILTGSIIDGAWSPDERLFAIALSTIEGSFLVVTNEMGDIIQKTLVPDRWVNSSDLISWSPDGKFISGTVRKSDSNQSSEILSTFIISADAKTSQIIPNTKNIGNIFQTSQWNSQGHLLALLTEKDGKQYPQLVDATKGIVQTFDPVKVTMPGFRIQWSPDGQWFLFGRFGEGFNIYGIDGASFTVEGTIENTLWLPDSSGILYGLSEKINSQSRMTKYSLQFWDRAKHNSQQLLELQGGTYLRISPAQPNALILGRRGENGNTELVVLHLNNLEIQSIPNGSALWSKEQSTLLLINPDFYSVVTGEYEKQNLLSYILKTKTEHEIATFNRPSEFSPDFDSDEWHIIRTQVSNETRDNLSKIVTWDHSIYDWIVYNERTQELHPIGTGKLEYLIQGASQWTGSAKDNRSLNIPYSGYVLTEPIMQNNKPLLRYTVHNPKSEVISTFLIDAIAMPVPTNQTLMNDDYEDWFYLHLLSPDTKHLLLTHQKTVTVSNSDGSSDSQEITYLYLAHDGDIPAKLIVGEPGSHWDNLKAFWSPDSNYFIAVRNVEKLETGDYSRSSTFYIDVYNVDGTLRWQRKFGRIPPTNIGIRRCGEPFPSI